LDSVVTVVVAWVRTLRDGTEELVVASDSRLNGGGNLDCAPKILTLPRSDAVIAFAGSTYFAYPLMLQLSQAIHAHSPLRDRAVDYHKLRDHAITVFNSMVSSFSGAAKALQIKETAFILGGYSWVDKAFMIDVISWRVGDDRFGYRPCLRGIGNFGKFAYAGDWGRRAFHSLTTTLKAQYGTSSVSRSSHLQRKFGWEPFTVIRDMLKRTTAIESIGGPPQLMRVTQHMNVRPTAVYWPSKAKGAVYLGGRPLMPYENVDHWILDPSTLVLSHPRFAAAAED
jgi:hypothetical protein